MLGERCYNLADSYVTQWQDEQRINELSESTRNAVLWNLRHKKQ